MKILSFVPSLVIGHCQVSKTLFGPGRHSDGKQGAQAESRESVAQAPAALEAGEHLAILACQMPGEKALRGNRSRFSQIVRPPVGAKAGNVLAHIEPVQTRSDEFDTGHAVGTRQMVQFTPTHERPGHGFGVGVAVGLTLAEHMPDRHEQLAGHGSDGSLFAGAFGQTIEDALPVYGPAHRSPSAGDEGGAHLAPAPFGDLAAAMRIA